MSNRLLSSLDNLAATRILGVYTFNNIVIGTAANNIRKTSEGEKAPRIAVEKPKKQDNPQRCSNQIFEDTGDRRRILINPIDGITCLRHSMISETVAQVLPTSAL